MNDRPNESLQIASGILAVVAPGLGHAALGHARRGALIATGVLGLFLTGLLIGGVDAVDSKNDPWWFVGQALVGPPAFAADWVNRSLSANDPAETASEGWRDAQQPSREKSFAHSNEMGMLFITIAGMLNLIAVIDAFWNAPAIQKDRRGVIGDLEGGAPMIDTLLAYRPFLDPLPLPPGAWWLTIIPMAFFIAVAYKAVRRNSLNGYWKSTLTMAAQIVFFIALAGLGVHAVVEWIAPALGG